MPAISTLLVANTVAMARAICCERLMFYLSTLRRTHKNGVSVLKAAVAWLPVMCRSHATGQHMGNKATLTDDSVINATVFVIIRAWAKHLFEIGRAHV